jgi:hypothetical protein
LKSFLALDLLSTLSRRNLLMEASIIGPCNTKTNNNPATMAKALFSIFVCEIEAILCSLVLFIMPFLLWRLLRLNFKAWYFVAISLSVPLLQGILYLFNGNHKNYALHVIYLIAIQDFYLWGLIHFVFHPLASYPGPFLWTISRLPQTYCLFRGTLPWKIHEIHKKYGPIVRLAPNELSYTTPEAWNDIYAKGEDKSQLRKDLGFTPSAATKVNGILFELDDNEHARLRYVNSLLDPRPPTLHQL